MTCKAQQQSRAQRSCVGANSLTWQVLLQPDRCICWPRLFFFLQNKLGRKDVHLCLYFTFKLNYIYFLNDPYIWLHLCFLFIYCSLRLNQASITFLCDKGLIMTFLPVGRELSNLPLSFDLDSTMIYPCSYTFLN